MRTVQLGAALLSLSLTLLGCSSAAPTDRTETGTLTDDDTRWQADQSPYDEYTVEVGEGWTITGDLTSTEFDPYLWLIGPGGDSLVQDDDGGGGTNAHFTHGPTTASGTYKVWANSYDGTGRGAYTLRIQATPAASEPTSPDPSE